MLLKNKIRSELLLQRQRLNTSQVKTNTDSLISQLVQHIQLPDFDQLLMYSSIKNEPMIFESWKQLPGDHQKFFLPRVQIKSKSMTFHLIEKKLHKLKPNKLGILEPEEGCQTWDPNKPTIAIVPCLGVSVQGHRMGYGGGFYDRFFTNYPKIYRCGVGMKDELIEIDFSENFDVPMHCYISPNKFFLFNEIVKNSQ